MRAEARGPPPTKKDPSLPRPTPPTPQKTTEGEESLRRTLSPVGRKHPCCDDTNEPSRFFARPTVRPLAGEQDKRRKHEQDVPKDLSGDLQALQALSEAEDDGDVSNRAVSSTDRKKAEAWLDNIKENRQRFLQFQIPEDKQRGVASGKAW